MTTAEDFLSDGATLWRRLVDVGGIEETGWDLSLAQDLRDRLGLGDSSGITEALAAKNVSADPLLRAFFSATKPYVQMWSDLLTMLQTADAVSADESVRIDYHFGEGDDPDVSFDVEHFKKAIQLLVPMQFDLRGIGQSHAWSLVRVGKHLADRPETLIQWTEAYRTHESWPASLPSQPPAVGNSRLDALLAEMWALATFVLDEMRSASNDRDELARHNWDGDPTTAAGTPIRVLYELESDHWLGKVVENVYQIAASPGSSAKSQDQLAAEVEPELDRFRNVDAQLQQLSDQVLEVLDLPLWKHRYELFSNWVCSVILTDLHDLNPRVHVVDGAIRFRSTGTHLATFDGIIPHIHLWTEMRTPLLNPRGKGRKCNIQPDITLLSDPITEPLRSRVVIECKQYKKPGYPSFADAIADYARGRPQAAVILADHGPVKRDTLLRHLGSDSALANRVDVVSDLRPDNSDALEYFGRVLRDGLSHIDIKSSPASSAKSRDRAPGGEGAVESTDLFVAYVRLRWTDPTTDLDLHVTVDVGGHAPVHVSYNNPGSLDVAPFVLIPADVRTGDGSPELVVIAKWIPEASYHVEVESYSGKSPADAGASVEIWTPSGSTAHRCSDRVDDVWHVGELLAPESAKHNG